MGSKQVLIACVVAALVAACDDSSKKAENKSSGSTTQTASTSSGPAPAPASVPQQKKETDKIDEAIFALKFFSANERDKAATEAKRILEEINQKVGELDGKADAAALTTLKQQGAEAQKEIDGLAADSETVWWKVANAYAKALLDHKRAYDKLAGGGA
jgi:superfamily I DNA and RNA helicase